jgi:cytochrome c biogenesis DsbD-like protein
MITALAALAALTLVQDPDVTKLYQVTTDGSTARVAAGQKGKLVLSIKLVKEAHVSDEAPLKITLTGAGGAAPEKATLTYADQISKKAAGEKYANPVVFEVPFTVDASAKAGAGDAAVKAKMTFFVCTEQICSRQQKEVSLPVQVCGGKTC